MQEYRFVRINDSNLKDLIPLFKNVFKSDISEEYLFKKYNTGAIGPKYIGYIAYDKNNYPAAYYGVFPILIEYKDDSILAAQSGDTMTHTEHRGKRLFTSLAEKTYQLAKEHGIKFVFGFPTQSSYPGFVNKLKWTHKENIKRYEFPVFTIPLCEIVKRSKWLIPIYSKYLNWILSFYKCGTRSIQSSLINEEYGGVKRDRFFFDYKSYSKNYFLKLNNKTVWIKIDGYLGIGDIERAQLKDFTKIIKKLKKISFLLGIIRIVFYISPNCYWDMSLSKKYKSSEGLAIGYVNFDSKIPLDKIKYSFGDFDTF